jgi:hypothetical protein
MVAVGLEQPGYAEAHVSDGENSNRHGHLDVDIYRGYSQSKEE